MAHVPCMSKGPAKIHCSKLRKTRKKRPPGKNEKGQREGKTGRRSFANRARERCAKRTHRKRGKRGPHSMPFCLEERGQKDHGESQAGVPADPRIAALTYVRRERGRLTIIYYGPLPLAYRSIYIFPKVLSFLLLLLLHRSRESGKKLRIVGDFCPKA